MGLREVKESPVACPCVQVKWKRLDNGVFTRFPSGRGNALPIGNLDRGQDLACQPVKAGR
jgi:hypothetical protein